MQCAVAVTDKVTHTLLEAESPLELSRVSFAPRGRVFPSPRRWKDQVLYQILPDRFCDGKDGRPVFDRENPEEFKAPDKAAWMSAGTRFNGGTLKGIAGKLDYLQGLGVTGIWLNPPWKQRPDLQTYHGYGIQNFLEIDPRFGTRQDLRDLVDAAHDRGMYVIVDVIFNHSGNNFYYRDEQGNPSDTMRYRFSPPHPIAGWHGEHGECLAEPRGIEDGVWPREFQDPRFYTRAGQIGNWGTAPGEDPMSPNVEFRRGDFFDLKDLNVEDPAVLDALIRVYQYWIAVSDCDGFRMDAIKHVSKDATRTFCHGIYQYALSIGKENFLLTGEITDNDMILNYMELHGNLIDMALPVALDIVAAPNKITSVVKGLANPVEFFDRYSMDWVIGRYLQLGGFHICVIDDHDMSSRSPKARFAANNDLPTRYLQVANAVGVQLTTPCIPCVYYGTEQAFDGNEGYHDYTIEPQRFAEDRYVRECMYGGPFGAFGTTGCSFFNPSHPTYLRISAMARLRGGNNALGRVMRGGHCYMRESAYCGYPFQLPPRGELVGWSRVLGYNEVLMVMNTHALEPRGAEITVDARLHPDGSTMTVRYRNDWSDEQLRDLPEGDQVVVKHHADGRASVRIDLPPAGMMILA